MLTFEEIKADVEEAQRVVRSELADAYPCEDCDGEGYVAEYRGDVEIRHDCAGCGSTGAWEFAEEARQVDAYLASSHLTVSTRSEIELRDCLIRCLAGAETLDDYRGPVVFDSPIIGQVPAKELDLLVEDMATDALEGAARCEPDGKYPYAFGALTAMFRRFLISARDQSLNEAIREARIASQAVSGNGGAAG